MNRLRHTIRKTLLEMEGDAQNIQDKQDGDHIDYPEVGNFRAIFHRRPKAKNLYSINIISDSGKYMGFVDPETGELWYNVRGQGNEYSGNSFPLTESGLKNAVRWMYLNADKVGGMKYEAIGEVKTNGEGDLMDYYNENPPALNNDYVDNFLDQKDYYISDKIAKNPPTPWYMPQ